MSAMVSQFTGVSIVCSTICSGTDRRKHQNSVSLAFVREIRRWPMHSRHIGPVMRKMFPLDFIMMTTPIVSYITRHLSCLALPAMDMISAPSPGQESPLKTNHRKNKHVYIWIRIYKKVICLSHNLKTAETHKSLHLHHLLTFVGNVRMGIVRVGIVLEPCAHHDDVIKWKRFPRYWPFVRGIQRFPVNSPHEGQ